MVCHFVVAGPLPIDTMHVCNRVDKCNIDLMSDGCYRNRRSLTSTMDLWIVEPSRFCGERFMS